MPRHSEIASQTELPTKNTDAQLVHIIEDDPIFAELIAKAAEKAGAATEIFHDAVSAIQNLDDDRLPALIFLDILLTGPNGFTYLNEIASYPSTNKIHIVIVSTLDFKNQDLSPYGVVKILDKATMYPEDITNIVRELSAVGTSDQNNQSAVESSENDQASAVESSEITGVDHARS